MNRNRLIWIATLIVTAVSVSGCSTPSPFSETSLELNQPVGTIIRNRRQSEQAESDTANREAGQSYPVTTRQSDITGQKSRFEVVSKGKSFINDTPTPTPNAVDGDITLNFNDADIHEVARTILGDILNRNYAINDKVQGKVSLHTSRPLSRDALIPTLDSLLFMHGAVLHDNGTLIEIVPQTANTSGGAPQLNLKSGQGFQTLVIPLRYISVKEMEKILKTVATERAKITLDEPHNLLLLSASQTELSTLLSTIETFDVNQLQGMSIGLFRLEFVDTGTILAELENVFGDDASGPLAGLVRFVPIERLNTIMVITPQPQYLKSARQWISRLDRMDSLASTSLHIYKVKHGKAEHLAGLLDQLFESQRNNQSQLGNRGSGPRSPSPISAAPEGQPDNSIVTSQGRLTPVAESGSLQGIGDVSIIADQENNSLLVMATQSDYAVIELALQKMDVLRQQVLVEATIVEVELSGDLQYGIEWFFKNGFSGNSKRGEGQLSGSQSGSGLSYSIIDGANDLRALFTILASDNRIDVISSPSLMVLDNQSASIKVGDQVPIATAETNSGDLLTTSVQYRDTGVLLEVTPQIKDGGMVVLDISQDVSNVSEEFASGIDSPTISQRLIQTTVAVQSGETLVLGGLIRENKDNGNSGVPGLKDVPGLGFFFGSKSKTNRRTELVVMITPTAIRSQSEAFEITEEFKRQMQGLKL